MWRSCLTNLDDFVYISKTPLLNLGYEVVDFDGTNLPALNRFSFNLKKDILIGSVEACSLFFKGCGLETPKYLGYPEELTNFDFMGREHHFIKFGDLPSKAFPYFIKPKDGVKLFTGKLIEQVNDYTDLAKLNPELKAETDLIMCDPLLFISEYRCFVHRGGLKGIHWYAGDFKVFPDIGRIQQMIKAYSSCPISYTLDVGVVDSPSGAKTILVEVNDMWAIGSYGLNGRDYVQMAIDRFQELSQ
jgi:hypothetical protein